MLMTLIQFGEHSQKIRQMQGVFIHIFYFINLTCFIIGRPISSLFPIMYLIVKILILLFLPSTCEILGVGHNSLTARLAICHHYSNTVCFGSNESVDSVLPVTFQFTLSCTVCKFCYHGQKKIAMKWWENTCNHLLQSKMWFCIFPFLKYVTGSVQTLSRSVI